MKNVVRLFFIMLAVALIGSALGDTQNVEGVCYAVTFAPLLWPAGSDNMGGYKGRIAFIPESAVKKVPTLPENPSETAEFVTAEGAFDFKKNGDKPTPIYATRATIGYKAEIQGEADCRSYKQSFEFFHPGSRVEAAAFARQVCNTPGYLLLEDGEHQILVGQPGYPCTISASFDGGKAPADKKGWSFTGDADSVVPMIVMKSPHDLDELFTEI